MQIFLQISIDYIFGFCIALGFALLFETPRKALLVTGILGGLGHAIRFILLMSDFFGPVTATLTGSVTVGLLGIYCAHKVHTPPVVFTLPACITMIPGLPAYRTMNSLLKIYTEGKDHSNSPLLYDAAYNFILTSSLLFCLAIGICIAMLLFRKQGVKDIGNKKKNMEKESG